MKILVTYIITNEGMIPCSGKFSGFGFENFLAVHVRAQDLRNAHAAIGLLELLKHSRKDAAGGQAGAIKSVQEFGFFAAFTAEADVAAPGLIVTGIGYGANFFIAAHAGDIHFDIPGFAHGGADVPSGELAQAEVQTELVDEAAGFVD